MKATFESFQVMKIELLWYYGKYLHLCGTHARLVTISSNSSHYSQWFFSLSLFYLFF